MLIEYITTILAMMVADTAPHIVTGWSDLIPEKYLTYPDQDRDEGQRGGHAEQL